MSDALPPISALEKRRRLRRITREASRLGFDGKLEYRHELSRTGGALLRIGSTSAQDQLVIYAEAFVRDATPDDFSLEAILAHERGHQLLHHHPRLPMFLERWKSLAAEELMASVLGSILARRKKDKESLGLKATEEALRCDIEPEDAAWLIAELRHKMEELL